MTTINIMIFNVVCAIIVALAGIVAKELVPYLQSKKDEALTSLRKTRWAWAADIIEAAVRAVEQTVSSEIHGSDKKTLAINYIMPLLRKYGITLTTDEVDKLIESAVQAMNAENITVEADCLEIEEPAETGGAHTE